MSLLNYLKFQTIDASADDDNSENVQKDEIKLNESIDEQNLENFWNQVVQDIHDDPEWSKFSDDNK